MKSLILLLLSLITLHAWPLDSLYMRAQRAIQVEWTPSEENCDSWFYSTYGATCTGEDIIYKESDFIVGKSYNSIAYSYGGEDNDETFLSKIEQGFLIGSHLCHYTSYGDPSDTIAGTDCSGFASWIWNEPRQSTRTYYNNKNYQKISRKAIEVGDALVKPGAHMAVVLEVLTQDSMLIVESTSAVNGVRQRIIDISEEYWLPYTPLRNRKLSGELSLPSSTLPNIATLHLEGMTLTGLAENETVLLLSPQGKTISSHKASHGTIALPSNLVAGVYILLSQSSKKSTLITILP